MAHLVEYLCRAESVEYCGNDEGNEIFQVVDGFFSNPREAIAVANATTMQHSPFSYTNKTIDAVVLKQFIEKLKQTKSRCLLIIELNSFPFIKVKFDLRDQEEVNKADKDTDNFSKDIIRVWKTYDQTKEIPVITVNNDIMSSNLKILKF